MRSDTALSKLVPVCTPMRLPAIAEKSAEAVALAPASPRTITPSRSSYSTSEKVSASARSGVMLRFAITQSTSPVAQAEMIAP